MTNVGTAKELWRYPLTFMEAETQGHLGVNRSVIKARIIGTGPAVHFDPANRSAWARRTDALSARTRNRGFQGEFTFIDPLGEKNGAPPARCGAHLTVP